jgi:uncharacterized membrane protein
MVDVLVVGTVHWLHVFLGVFWFGTILYTRLVLFPSLATLPKEQEQAVRRAMLAGRGQMYTKIFAYGTVLLGIVRGAITGVFGQLNTAYGITYLAALAIGVVMLIYLFAPLPFSHPILPKLYVWAFPVMFTLMVLMRFGY